MRAINTVLKSAFLSVSVTGGLIATALAVKAMPGAGMPSGYTLSPKEIKGQHCYRHNNEANLYCYRTKVTEAMMMQHSSTMTKQDSTMMKSNSTMMKKDDSMMKPNSTVPSHDSTMMKKDDSMMKK